APCSVALQKCSYGDTCCPPTYICKGGVWALDQIDCVIPESCPAAPPKPGSPCGDACHQDSPCGYACDGGMSSLASCSGGTWQVNLCECSPGVIPCGDMSCTAGQVCVLTSGGPGETYSCAPDPCAPGPLSCMCAVTLCGGSPFECNIVSASQVSC